MAASRPLGGTGAEQGSRHGSAAASPAAQRVSLRHRPGPAEGRGRPRAPCGSRARPRCPRRCRRASAQRHFPGDRAARAAMPAG